MDARDDLSHEKIVSDHDEAGRTLPSKRRTRPSRWPAVAVALLLLAAASLALWVGSLRGALEEAQARAGRELADAVRAGEEARGALALAALRGQDALGAREASAGLQSALGRGVAARAAEAGAPARRWTLRSEAGCAALAVSGEVVACATLNQVLLARLADGVAAGSLETGPRGWQQGLAALPGGRLAAAGDDRTLRLFEVASRRLVRSQVLDDSVSAVSGDGAGGVVVGLQGGQVLGPDGAVLQRHRRAVTSLVAAPGLLASASSLETLVTRHGEPGVLDRRAGALGLRGGELLVGVERTLAVLDALGRSRPVGTHRGELTAVVALEDGRLVSGDAAGQLRWWSPEGALLGVAQVAALPVQALEPAGPGEVLVAAGRTLEAWTLPAVASPPWSEPPTAAAVSPVRGQVLAGFADGRVRRTPGPELEVRHQGAVRALAEVPGDEQPRAWRLLSGGDDGRVLGQRWSGEVEPVGEAPGARVLSLAVAPDGRRAAWASSDGALTLHSLEFGKPIRRLEGPRVRALAFAPGGRTLAVGREDRRLQLLDAETGAELAVFEPFDAEVTAVAWLTAGAVVAARADGAVSECLVAERRVARRWTGPTRRVTALAADASSGRVAAGTADGQVWVWALEGAGPVAQLPADVGEVRAVGFLEGALTFVGGDRLVHAVPLP